MRQMEWKNLTVASRLGCPPVTSYGDQEEARSEFERDFDRIIFSTAFRRLQGKTQVFPLPESDMTHTRLMHSLEVACVGRSLGRIVGNRLQEEGANAFSLGSIVSAACLAHDIGNPPFGHSGENAIRAFFQSTAGRDLTKSLSVEQRTDLTQFEGNAAGFRVLTSRKPVQTENPGGFSLTLATLAAYTKYPRMSYSPGDSSNRASERKSGIFYDDLASFKEVARGLQIGQKSPESRGWVRHPLALPIPTKFTTRSDRSLPLNPTEGYHAIRGKLTTFLSAWLPPVGAKRRRSSHRSHMRCSGSRRITRSS
jgi:dGTPase